MMCSAVSAALGLQTHCGHTVPGTLRVHDNTEPELLHIQLTLLSKVTYNHVTLSFWVKSLA